MNFFEHQDRARNRTTWLVLAFLAAVFCILALTNIVVIATIANTGESQSELVIPDAAWLSAHIEIVIVTSLIVLLIIGGASLFRMARLSSGGGAVARSLGGVQVASDVSDFQHRRLRNVVEEVALASGVPVPDIFVLEQEEGINAFAAGFSPNDAAIAVSRGCIEHLNRDELQGVIAHEFSHVLNGDMRLNIRLIGLLFGILVIGLAGREILRVGRFSRNRKGAPLVLVGLAFLIIGFAGLFFGRLIQAAVSRQRELLADASAVQFTRNPQGIAGALKKIAALSVGSRLESTDATEVSHMLFADGIGRQLFATHPPLEDRIRAIDPHFDPSEIRRLAGKMALGPVDMDIGSDQRVAGFSSSADTIDAGRLVESVGAPSWDHVAYAEKLRAELDPEVLGAAHSNTLAVDLVLALMLDSDPSVVNRQLRVVDDQMGGEHLERVARLARRLRNLNPLHRLPLVELALPTLKKRPKSAQRKYIDVMQGLIHADGSVDIYEFALSRLVRHYLIESMAPTDEGHRGRKRVRDVRDALQVVLAVLARSGHESDDAARRAFNAGWSHLFPMKEAEFAPPAEWVDPVADALDRIDRVRPSDKEIIIEAMVATLDHDDRITLEEVELLRAICASLHCPMPPNLGSASAATETGEATAD